MGIAQKEFHWKNHTPHWKRGRSPGFAFARFDYHPEAGWLSIDTHECTPDGRGKRTIITMEPDQVRQLLELLATKQEAA